ncbi:hypothetical protein Anapl_15813 [Anas platyrhynchos]|uniref:Uncharacterized protein n=1 Tax=Anas platyrhynchos TaxID=8839 RepID=R0L0H7_ANAPL|nr:hypothetical protein Anapl_15813 [Anas platyrhynchos]
MGPAGVNLDETLRMDVKEASLCNATAVCSGVPESAAIPTLLPWCKEQKKKASHLLAQPCCLLVHVLTFSRTELGSAAIPDRLGGLFLDGDHLQDPGLLCRPVPHKSVALHVAGLCPLLTLGHQSPAHLAAQSWG